MAIQGLRDTSGFTVVGQRPENWREGTLLLFPNGEMPLVALSSLMKSESTDDAKYHWYEKIYSDQRMALAASLDATPGSDPVTLVSGGFECRDGTLLLVEQTREILLVTAVTSDSAITVTRAWGPGTAVPATAVTWNGAGVNPYLTIIGTVMEEGSSAPTSIMYDPTEHWNHTEIFRNTLEATRTAINTRLRTGEHVREAKRECLQYHTMEMERAAWFGERHSDTKNGKPRRSTEGFYTWLNRLAPGQIVSPAAAHANVVHMSELEDWTRQLFEYGSSEKMGFAGNRAMMAIQRCIRKNSDAPYTIIQGQKEFGMNVSRLICPFGELVIKQHPMFSRMGSASQGGTWYYSHDSSIAIMDMDNVRYRYLKNSDTKFTDNIQLNDTDGKKAGYLTECGFEFHHAKSHMWWNGLGSGGLDV